MPPVWRRLGRLPLSLCLWLAGCSVLSQSELGASPNIHEHELHCARATMGANSPYRMPLAPPVSDPVMSRWLDILPPEARHVARAGGLEPLLVDLLLARAELPAGVPASPRMTTLQHELTLRLIALDSQVSSLAFEVSCTRQRITALLGSLDRREGDRQFSLAAASLIIGAVTGIVAGVWGLRAASSNNVPAYIGIGGGVATTVLGGAALLQPARWVRLDHSHNVLRPVAVGEDPEHLYPSFVFRMLTVQYEGEATTARVALLADFQENMAQVGNWRRERIEDTVFGVGGHYDRVLLELRESLLRTLESAVQGVARDLELLNRSLVRALTAPRLATPPSVGRAP